MLRLTSLFSALGGRQSLNTWPTAQGLFANTLEYLWEFMPVKDTGLAPEDKEFATATTQQDNVLRAHQLAKWMSYFLVTAWERSEDDATNIIFPSFSKVRALSMALCEALLSGS